MKLKHAVFPYILFLLIIPALTAHMAVPLHMDVQFWEAVTDITMAATALIGLAYVIISRKKSFTGWIPLILLLFLVVVPQLYLWHIQQKNISDLRQIYRFALFSITLFIIPQEIHYTGKELCILIGCITAWGLICCGYEIWKNPKVWEGMNFFSGKKSSVTSIFGHRNRFGAYSALWLILCLFATQMSKKRIWLLPSAVFAGFLVMTESRGGILLAGLYMLFSLISYRRRLGTKNLLMILADIAIVIVLLLLIPPVRIFVTEIIDLDRGVTGRDSIWQVSWNYYLESNPLLGHGLGVNIEKIMAERLQHVVSTHNVYLYILNSGGILLMLYYISAFIIILKHKHHRRHYHIPLILAVSAYGMFELACAPFDNWHLSTMFTVCLFFFPAAAGINHRKNHLPIH